MPGTPNGVADEEPLRKRAAVVRADRSDREKRVASTREESRPAMRVAQHHGPILERSRGDPLREIRSNEGRLAFSHVRSP